MIHENKEINFSSFVASILEQVILQVIYNSDVKRKTHCMVTEGNIMKHQAVQNAEKSGPPVALSGCETSVPVDGEESSARSFIKQ